MFSFTRFSQIDPRWKNQPMGFDPNATIGSLGCLLTDLAMIATGFGFDETPATLNQKIKALGPDVGFRGALVVPAILTRILPGVVFRDFIDCHNIPAPLDRIDDALDANQPVIVQIDFSPAAGLQSHWLLLYGKKNGDYLLQDPWPYPPHTGEVLLGNSPFTFAGGAEQVILTVVLLEGPLPRANKPDGAVSVYATVDQLALRSEPWIGASNLLKRVLLLAELYSLETIAATLQKVGSPNQWLNVQDPDGTQGYAAAWYLNTKNEIPGQTPPSLPPGETLIVYATADQLALRTRPVVDATTLIKRVAIHTALTVLDSPAAAAAKMGVVNAWLKVKDSGGATGYIAAWYVTLTSPEGLGPGTVTPPLQPPIQTLVVQTTVPALALRTRPVIAPDTLIKRLDFGAVLTVIEPLEGAIKKVGANDQWLKVRDAVNAEGYVAAWYVK